MILLCVMVSGYCPVWYFLDYWEQCWLSLQGTQPAGGNTATRLRFITKHNTKYNKTQHLKQSFEKVESPKP